MWHLGGQKYCKQSNKFTRNVEIGSGSYLTVFSNTQDQADEISRLIIKQQVSQQVEMGGG